ncbi:unnamed protein product [Cylindrotheca closterium]|uniref:Uncharacterized protein n=1 Tax=Cylindrotheca closterium TaxID=2856 RepID=A0AAD2PWZ0_9STRA|nr:unnamed protein product [Cylindrotheca closterium]
MSLQPFRSEAPLGVSILTKVLGEMGLKFGCGQLPGQGLVCLEQQAANLPGAYPALTSALEEKAPQGDPIPNGLAFRRPFRPAHQHLPAVLLRQPSNCPAWNMGGFRMFVSAKETVQVKVDPQATVIGGNVFVKGSTRRPGWARQASQRYRQSYTHGGFAGGQVIIGIDAQDDGTTVVAPFVDCRREVLDESFPGFCVAVGAAEVGLVLEPYCLMPVVGWVWSVGRDHHQVALANALCLALKTYPSPLPQAIVATGPDLVRDFIEGRSRVAPKLSGRMGHPWLMGIVGHRRMETFALPSHSAGSFTPSVGWCNSWP